MKYIRKHIMLIFYRFYDIINSVFGGFMDINEIKLLAKKDKKAFVEKFGYFLMSVSRNDLPDLIETAMGIDNEILNKKILNDMSFLLKKVRIGRLGDLIDILSKNPIYYNQISNKFDDIKEYFAPNNIEKVMQCFLKNNINSKIVADNLEIFLESAKTRVQAQRMMEDVKHIPKCNQKINQYKSAILRLGDYHFLESLNAGTMMKLINTGALEDVKGIFKEYSEGDLENINYLANGFTSTVFSVGDKIIKIGKKRIKFDAKFSGYLLQPYLRKEFLDIEGNVIFTVEVQDKCATTNIEQQKIDEFKESLKKEFEQFVWMDASDENVFVLLKDNTRKISPKEDGFSYEGIEDYAPKGKKGDCVIGDTDFIYSPKEFEEREDSFKTPKHSKTFSLILPTYNMEEYIEKCLNSILNQTCGDYEVLIIDDGSPDKSAEIAKEYVESDSRFKLLSFENGGLSVARNRGIKAAEGEYIIFIDPDDTIQPELLEKLKPYVEKGIETVRFGAVVVNENPQKDIYRFNRPFYPEITTGVEALKIWNKDKRYSTAWLYCTKKEVFDRCNFEFPDVRIYEDLASMPSLIANSKSVAMLDYIGYNYIQNDKSITNREKPNKQLCNLGGFIKAYDFITEALNRYFSENPYDEETQNILLDGFFSRVEEKFRHTNSFEKDIYAKKLFNRNRIFKIDYNENKYLDLGKKRINQETFYTPENSETSIKYDDTTISRIGKYTYNINGFIDTVNLYRVEKEGKYNFTDRFLCMANINFDRIETDERYKEIVFKYLTSYTNLFLAESLNGSYIGDIKQDKEENYSIVFDENITTFAKNFRNVGPRICKESSLEER